MCLFTSKGFFLTGVRVLRPRRRFRSGRLACSDRRPGLGQSTRGREIGGCLRFGVATGHDRRACVWATGTRGAAAGTRDRCGPQVGTSWPRANGDRGRCGSLSGSVRAWGSRTPKAPGSLKFWIVKSKIASRLKKLCRLLLHSQFCFFINGI